MKRLVLSQSKITSTLELYKDQIRSSEPKEPPNKENKCTPQAFQAPQFQQPAASHDAKDVFGYRAVNKSSHFRRSPKTVRQRPTSPVGKIVAQQLSKEPRRPGSQIFLSVHLYSYLYLHLYLYIYIYTYPYVVYLYMYMYTYMSICISILH